MEGRTAGDVSEEELRRIMGLVIRKLRRDRDWTQPDLGQKAGYGRNSINNIEHGKPASLHALWHVARALDITLGTLIRSAENNGEPYLLPITDR
jgi:transcriptional regulator with XRE-family HTH domain